MRLTDLPSKIPMLDALGIEDPNIPLDEVMAIGAGLSAAAAVMWVMSHPEAPIASAGMERTREGADMAMEMMERLSANINNMTAEQIESAANVLKVLAPLGLLTS